VSDALPPQLLQKLVDTRRCKRMEETMDKELVASRRFTLAGKQVQPGEVVEVPDSKRDILIRTRYIAERPKVPPKDVTPPKRKRGRPRKHPVAATG
jgi:hypothetical protein